MKNKLIKNYINLTRLNRPLPIWLVFLPSAFGLSLAFKKLPEFNLAYNFYLIVLFLLGAIVMRSAGCVVNDLLDRKFDAKVKRTKSRPLASGEVSVKEAMILLAFLLSCGLLILLQFNQATIMAGIFALVLILAYPLMKRITYYPQIFLGIVYNFGLIIASLAVFGEVGDDFFVLYLACIIWTLIYDTIYAYQDIEDDLKIGVKSTAVRFGKHPQKILLWCNLVMFLLLIAVGLMNDFEIIYFLIIFFASLFSLQKIKKCDFADPESCLKTFKDDVCIGLLILFAIISG